MRVETVIEAKQTVIHRPGDRRLREWLVMSPVFPATERVLDDGSGPIYDMRDVVQVQAYTKAEAITVGVKQMLKERMSWVREARADNRSPFAGIVAEVLECPHGAGDFEGCPACAYELAATERSGFFDIE